MPSEKIQPRDPNKPAAYFKKVAYLYQRAIEAAIKLQSTAVLNTIADYYLRVARALYSAGASTPNCKTELANAAQYFTCHLSASKDQPLHGIPNMVSYLENMSAACLAGTIQTCVQELNTACIEIVLPWEEAILTLISTVYEGKGTLTKKLDMNGAPPEYGSQFTDLFLTVMHKDHNSFPKKLEKYLTKVWAPPRDRDAKHDLISKPPSYTGNWALFAASLCKVMGEVPTLSPKAIKYVPVDLIDVADSGDVPYGDIRS